MNPNSEVWGLPSSWQNCKYRVKYSAVAPEEIKAIVPQIADFGSGDGSLYAGNLHGKTPINTMIDETICPCGQDPKSSVYGKIGLFYNYQNVDANKVPNRVIEQSTPVNWFFYDAASATLDSGRLDHRRDRQAANARWAPEMTMTDNDNGRINPFVYYQIRSLMFQVVVATVNGYNTYGEPVIDWKTAYDWKTNFSSRKILDVRLQTYTYFSNTDTTITYYGVIEGASYTSNGISLLIKTSDEYSENIIDYAIINSGKWSMPYLIGSVIGGNWYEGRCFYMCGYNTFENQEYKTVVRQNDTQHGWSIWTEIPYSAANYEKIMKMCACFGVLFTDTGEFTFRLDGNDNNLCVPVIDENGVAHGEYTRGSDSLDNDFLQLDSIRDKNYNPEKPVDPNTYSSQTYFNPILNLSSMCKRYVLNDAAVEQLCRDLWKISDDLIHTDPNEDFKDYDQLMLDNFLVNSPIDVIVSLDKYPISNIPTGTNSEAIKYGKATGAALGKPLTTNTIFFNFEGVRIYPKFGDCFLDYSPYTCYELYIPFCGIVQIDPGDIMGHILSVQMVMDLSTGAVTAYIMADNLCIETANGTAAINIPVSGIDSVTLNSQINNALIAAKSAQMQARSSGTLTGRIAGGLKSIKESLNPRTATMQRASDAWTANLADYDLTHMPISPHKIGSASAACSWSLELTCRLMIYYPEGDAIDSSGGITTTSPKLADLTMYGHTTGFAVISSGLVSNYHGFTVGNIDTSSIAGATEAEREMIKALFSQGVYLP